MMSPRLAALAFAAGLSMIACAPEAPAGREELGSTTSKLGRPVTTPKAAGSVKTHALAASHAAPKSRHTYGLKAAPLSTKHSGSLHIKADAADPPESVDLSQNTPPIVDQGQTSACVTFALGYNAMGWWAAQTGMAGAPFAPMYLYSQIVQGNCEQPTLFTDSLDILTQQGIASDASYQPMQSNLDCATLPTRRAAANASAHKVTDYSDIDLSNPELGIKQALAAGVPVVIGMETYSAIENVTRDNFLIDPPMQGEQSSGGHAVALFAYDDVGVWFANSWGAEWGVDGWAQLSWEFINGSQGGVPNLNGAVAITAVSQ